MPSQWQAAKAALALVLEGLVATIPDGDDGDTLDATLKRVFTEPPASVEPGNLPCIIFGESTLSDNWGAGAAREVYVLNSTLLLRDEDAARSIAWAEAWRESVKNALRSPHAIELLDTDHQPTGQIVEGASYTALGAIGYAGQTFDGFMFRFPIVINDVLPDD